MRTANSTPTVLQESGREACHYILKQIKPRQPEPTSGLHRTIDGKIKDIWRRASSGSVSFRRRSTSTRGSVASSRGSTSSRHNSISSRAGYDDSDNEDLIQKESTVNVSFASNTMRMEFSNYAKVDIKRRGSTSSKRYDFEYWDSMYSWKRVVEKGDRTKDSYHLLKDNGTTAIAHIVGNMLTRSEVLKEKQEGYWVQPCSLWISDQRAVNSLTELAE